MYDNRIPLTTSKQQQVLEVAEYQQKPTARAINKHKTSISMLALQSWQIRLDLLPVCLLHC